MKKGWILALVLVALMTLLYGAAAEEAVLSGEIVVDTAIGENAIDVTALREAVRP